MLDELHISNVALIRDAWFSPAESFTVITGETGSGKTALLSALKLLIGARAESTAIREGEDELKVEGRFFFNHSTDETLVTRRVSLQGRSRASLNGSMASVKDLVQLISPYIDLCSQHEHQRLMNPASHIELLDAWGQDTIQSALETYQEAFNQAKFAKKQLETCKAEAEGDSKNLDAARFVVRKIEEVNPEPQEYEQLLDELPKLEHAESLLSSASDIKQCLSGDNSVMEKAEIIISQLEHMARIDNALSSSLQAARDAYFSYEDILQEVSSYATSIEYSSDELEKKQERIAQFQGLMRNWGPTMDEVFRTLEENKEFIARFDSRDELLAQAQAEYEEAERNLARAAHSLSKVRHDVLPSFLQEVNAQLSRLEMGSARLEGQFNSIERDKWTKNGSEQFELLFAPGQGFKFQRFTSIASGGEISRVMLAIKVVLGEKDNVETLVFDEIDTGVGGQTALALAEVLKDLSKTHQVIVVTHLAQVAARADKHYQVIKRENEKLETEIRLLNDTEREAEIARMLSGEVTKVSLSHAKELIAAQ